MKDIVARRGADGEWAGPPRSGPRVRAGHPGRARSEATGGTRSLGRRGADAAPVEPVGPLILTEDGALLDDLLRLCAAAGARAQVGHGPPDRDRWESAPLVIVGDDAAARLRGSGRRRGVVLVSRAPESPELWRHAVEVGADHALVLPDGEKWLVDRIADVAEGAGCPALTVGVLGGSGGAGASTLACALALASARAGRRTLLVDADPLGGGLDVMLGAEEAEGLRWPAFAGSRGRVGGGALEEALPALHGLRVLSWDRGEPVPVPPQAVRAVLAAARRGGGSVVVDLPRHADASASEALAQLDLALLVVPAALPAVAAAGRTAAAVRPVVRDLRAVVRPARSDRSGRGPDGAEVARLLGLPHAGDLPHDPGLPAAQDTGRPPGHDPRGPLARFGTAFWQRVVPGPDGATA